MNESLQYRRRERRWRYRGWHADPTSELRHGKRIEEKGLLDKALARVDPELRCIFLLREVEGLSNHDIAEALDVPEGTVGSRLNRARRELREQLVELGFELPK